MLHTILIFAAGAIAASAYFLLKTRRHTPYLELDLDSLPAIDEGMATLAGLTSGAVYEGNAVRLFQNGAIFDAIFKDIEAARCTVHFETFVWSEGELERRTIELLSRKAREGVKVRVLIDALGGNERNEERLKSLQAAGAQVCIYSQVTLFNLRRFNHRTHRKLLICDGQVGYTFGHGFSDQWLGDAHDSKHVRDTGVRIEGPAVSGLQSVFTENWIEESHCVPTGDGCFPTLEPKGDISMHVVSSASGDQVSAVALLYTVAIACARREIIIQNPYFAPDDGLCELLGTMVKRGVAVHLMVPGEHTDNPFVRRAGFALYQCLLEGGVRLYEYEPHAAAPEDRHHRPGLVACRFDQFRFALARAERGSGRRVLRPRAGRRAACRLRSGPSPLRRGHAAAMEPPAVDGPADRPRGVPVARPALGNVRASPQSRPCVFPGDS